jgi:hypothetical protein
LSVATNTMSFTLGVRRVKSLSGWRGEGRGGEGGGEEAAAAAGHGTSLQSQPQVTCRPRGWHK